MTPTHQTLRALAEAALAHEHEPDTRALAEFAKALTPRTVLGLLDEIEEQRGEGMAGDAAGRFLADARKEMRDERDDLKQHLAEKEQECERWKAASIRLQGAVYEWRTWSDDIAPPFGSSRDRSDKGQRDAIITDMAALRSALAEACGLADAAIGQLSTDEDEGMRSHVYNAQARVEALRKAGAQ